MISSRISAAKVSNTVSDSFIIFVSRALTAHKLVLRSFDGIHILHKKANNALEQLERKIEQLHRAGRRGSCLNEVVLVVSWCVGVLVMVEGVYRRCK
jgi:hypothetical protein